MQRLQRVAVLVATAVVAVNLAPLTLSRAATVPTAGLDAGSALLTTGAGAFVLPGSPLVSGQPYVLHYSWQIPDTAPVTVGDTFEVTLPSNVRVTQDLSLPVKNGGTTGATTIGTLAIAAGAQVGTVTLNDALASGALQRSGSLLIPVTGGAAVAPGTSDPEASADQSSEAASSSAPAATDSSTASQSTGNSDGNSSVASSQESSSASGAGTAQSSSTPSQSSSSSVASGDSVPSQATSSSVSSTGPVTGSGSSSSTSSAAGSPATSQKPGSQTQTSNATSTTDSSTTSTGTGTPPSGSSSQNATSNSLGTSSTAAGSSTPSVPGSSVAGTPLPGVSVILIAVITLTPSQQTGTGGQGATGRPQSAQTLPVTVATGMVTTATPFSQSAGSPSAGRLPQTNDQQTPLASVIGVLGLAGVTAIGWFRRQRKN